MLLKKKKKLIRKKKKRLGEEILDTAKWEERWLLNIMHWTLDQGIIEWAVKDILGTINNLYVTMD